MELVGSRVARDGGLGVDVGEVGGDARGAGDIVEGKLGDEGVDLFFFLVCFFFWKKGDARAEEGGQ